MKTDRRKFIKTEIALAAGITLAGKNVAFNRSSRIIDANDSVNLAVIGVRGHRTKCGKGVKW